jgi:hypothetical protein
MRTNPIRCALALALLALMGLAQAAWADPTGGPRSGALRAPARGTTVHAIVYNGGEQADFAIVGDGDTTLNIVVKDANGMEVVRTRGPGDRCRVTWRPRTTAVYYISVVNEGNVYNEYRWLAY